MFAAYRDCLRENRTEAESLLDSLRITYSEFFRNPLTFALLEQRVLPALIERKALTGEEIRIWSAACAAGEEPYSIAILLDQIASATGKAIPARIFATDIGEEGLATARVGSYNASALRNVTLKHLQDCFTSRGDRYCILPRLRENIHFSAYDLLDERTSCPPSSIFGEFDLIFCNNMLFYYRVEIRSFLIAKLQRCMAPEGYLASGEAEREIVGTASGLRAVFPYAAIFTRRNRR
jgi:chemotaxis methyl-accepting protein methylase